MRNIVSYFSGEELKEAKELFLNFGNVSFSGIGNSSSKALLISDLCRDKKSKVKNVLWICNGEENVHLLTRAMTLWSDRPVFSYSKIKEDRFVDYGNSADFKRAKELSLMELVLRINSHNNAIFVLDFESLLQDFPDVEVLKKANFSLTEGENISSVEIIERLVNFGYEVTDEQVLHKGEYFRVGDSLFVFPLNGENVIRIELGFDLVEKISVVNNSDYSDVQKSLDNVHIFSTNVDYSTGSLLDYFEEGGMIVDDEIDVIDENFAMWTTFIEEAKDLARLVSFSSFNDDEENHKHMHYLSVLKYRSAYDLANDLRDKIGAGYKTLYFTKYLSDVKGLLNDQSVPYKVGISDELVSQSSLFLLEVDKDDYFPLAFQNSSQKMFLITDHETPFIRGEEKKSGTQNVFDDFLMSLKVGDYVVHADHGIARFMGLDQKTVDGITKEYLALGYAQNDKLFVPIDQADKVNKYIGSAELMPKLTRLGSVDWNTVTTKVRKETQKIAKELLKLYAERKAAMGFKYGPDDNEQVRFEATFPYDETPGQIKAIEDVKKDMESEQTMDRLICGDVGFGKTEVAMRAAFKAVKNGKQVALVSPITILTDQHFKSFEKRMNDFHIRVEMLSRFRSPSEQKKIIEKLKKGEIDIIIGTHRLLQADIKFKDLGLIIIDEEQRFGVKQKEKLKAMRKEVDILTLTATPIPRTLNIALNKLRDITTITTPPFGRLPIITEVRKYSSNLVRDVILKEIERKGQVYFLHNRVQTIDSFAAKLKLLVPEARFIVAHGKLGSGDLEDRIMAFKEGRYDVLVSSTIIENGIDLSNANTLIVNSAEKFGLSQLYQLRGRVGRGKAQAFAYFLYNGQRLKLDAKKRLRAIVEASDLGSGFQIAMKDLEIRGAGDILGANQHGVISVVGVAHFMRMLNKAVEDLKAGRVLEDGTEDISDVSIELPVPAYIPETYIVHSNDKILAYQKLAACDNIDYLEEIKAEIISDYGKMPRQVNNLFRIIELKILAKNAGLLTVRSQVKPMSKEQEIEIHLSGRVKPAHIINLLEYNSAWQIIGNKMKIDMVKLGSDWFKELKECVKRLSVKAKHGE